MPRLRIQIGPTIKQYGRFHLKQFEVYRDDKAIPTHAFQVVLEHLEGGEDHLETITTEESYLEGMLKHLHIWHRGVYIDITRAKHFLPQTDNDLGRAGYLMILQEGTLRYTRLLSAIRELEPDYQPDESLSILILSHHSRGRTCSIRGYKVITSSLSCACINQWCFSGSHHLSSYLLI